MRHNECDVLVTYCWNRVGYNILRSLSAHGLKVWVADVSKNNICSLSKFCAGAFVYPDPFTEESAFIDCLKRWVDRLNPTMLLPTHDESQVIMRHREEFPPELIIPYEPVDILEKLSDKARATELASHVGVPVPKVYERPEAVETYPCVFKTVIGNSAKGVWFPGNYGELAKLMEAHAETRTMIEEKVGGCDYSVDCVRWDGFFCASTYRALVTKTDGGGTTTQREIVSRPDLEAYAERLLSSIDFKGVCGLDFRYDAEADRVAFIEANVRFTGGLATPVTAGFDIPWVLYCLAVTGNYEEPVDVRVGTRTKWILGDVITLVGRILSFKFDRREWKQALSFKGFDAFDDYRSDDRRAILGEMSYYLGKLLKNGKLNP